MKFFNRKPIFLEANISMEDKTIIELETKLTTKAKRKVIILPPEVSIAKRYNINNED